MGTGFRVAVLSGFGQANHGFALALEAKDSYTHGHSESVTRLCVAMAEEMGCPETFKDCRGGVIADKLIAQGEIDDLVLPSLLDGTANPDGIHYSWRTHELIGHAVAEELQVVGFTTKRGTPQRKKATR